jgi:hypothetical protein
MRDQAEASVPLQPAPWGTLLATGAALLAAWAAAGSLGWMSPVLRHAMVWLGIAVAILGTNPFRAAGAHEITTLRLTGSQWAVIFAVVLAVGAPLWLSDMGGVLGVALLLAALANTQAGPAARLTRLAAFSVAGFAWYRFAVEAVPAVWMATDLVGQGLGRIAGSIALRPLRVGATMAGLDLLVLSAGMVGGWIGCTRGPRARRMAAAGARILIGHLVFLIVLCFADDIAARLPAAPAAPESDLEQTPLWFWGDAVRSLLPWNAPLLGGLIHIMVVTGILRRTIVPDVGLPPNATGGWPGRQFRVGFWAVVAVVGLAVVMPAAARLAPFRADLAGRTVAVYDRGLFDWGRPTPGRYGDTAAGTLGMLPDLVESLHGRLTRTQSLAPADLAQVDLLVLFHPTRPWSETQLQQLWDYVKRGGALLVVAENRVEDGALRSAFDEVLAGTAICVRDDSAVAASTDWEGGLQTAGCAAAVDVPAALNPFGIEAGSSLQLGLRADPLVVGRYGFSGSGSDSSTDGGRYTAGRPLGDLVLAAQQRVGQGRVVVLGDANPLTNLGTVSAYPFTARLLAWMANRGSDPQAGWRQALVLADSVLLIVLVLSGGVGRLSLAILAFGLSLFACATINARTSEVLPDGRRTPSGPSRLAYIGAGHLEGHAGSSWADDGINGLALSLMRSGHLALLLDRLDAARLERAGMLISIAPGRSFSTAERDVIRRFVERGGIWVCTVGAEQSRVVAPMLAEFGFDVPHSPVGPTDKAHETEAVGAFYAPYYETDKGLANVLFREGWPIAWNGQDVDVHVENDQGAAFVATRPVGHGMVAVIGDSKFALNRNLERPDGQPVAEGFQNGDFWRWFLTVIHRQTPWVPPLTKPAAATKAPAKEGRP